MSHPSIAPPMVPVALREVSKLYRHGPTTVRALDGISVEFAPHSFTAVMGPSGSGKSTLLHCAAGHDHLLLNRREGSRVLQGLRILRRQISRTGQVG